MTQGFTTLRDGSTNFDFWLNGQVLYISIVLIANLKILQSFNNFNGLGELTVFFMIFNFLWFYLLENYMHGIHNLYQTFGEFFSAGSQMWLCVVFNVGYIFTIDKIVTYSWRYAYSKYRNSSRGRKYL